MVKRLVFRNHTILKFKNLEWNPQWLILSNRTKIFLHQHHRKINDRDKLKKLPTVMFPVTLFISADICDTTTKWFTWNLLGIVQSKWSKLIRYQYQMRQNPITRRTNKHLDWRPLRNVSIHKLETLPTNENSIWKVAIRIEIEWKQTYSLSASNKRQLSSVQKQCNVLLTISWKTSSFHSCKYVP